MFINNNALTEGLKGYLDDTLGLTIVTRPWSGEKGLPLFLRDRYAFLETALEGRRLLLMLDQNAQAETPAAIGKHMAQVQAKGTDAVIYIKEKITAYNRKRFIKQKTPFIVPGNQMYLPTLGLDLREHFPKAQAQIKTLSPAAQATLFFVLLKDVKEPTPTNLAEELGYAVMTMSRAFGELETTGIATTTATGRGRDRVLQIGNNKQKVWKTALPFLKTPVMNIHVIPEGNIKGLKAGLTALAHYSMLAVPNNDVIAVTSKAWKAISQKNKLKEAMPDEPGTVTVEVWRYDPALMVTGDCVDCLSLYLALHEDKDERVQAAPEEMVDKLPW